MKVGEHYSTTVEASFIRLIGMWSETPSLGKEVSRLEKLRGYRAGLLKRALDYFGRPLPPSTREVLLQVVDEQIDVEHGE